MLIGGPDMLYCVDALQVIYGESQGRADFAFFDNASRGGSKIGVALGALRMRFAAK